MSNKTFLRVGLFFSVLLLSLLLTSSVYAKSYWLPQVDCRIDVQEDGSLLWRYSLRFSFSGKFSYAYMDIPTAGIKIEEVSSPEKISIENRGDHIRVRWDFSAENEEKTFNLSYKMSNVLKVYNDIAEFYWKVWSEGWDVKVGKLNVKVYLPGKVSHRDELYIWGHPRLPGRVDILNTLDGFSLETEDISSNQWVEIRALFPATVLSSYSGAIRINKDMLEDILREEENFTRQTEKEKYYLSLAISGGLGVFLCMIVILIYLYFIYGREPKINYQGIYEREIPYDYSPAIVGAIMNLRTMTPGTRDFTATLLDLVHKGYIDMTPVGDDYILSLKEKDRSNLEPFEMYILEYLKGIKKKEDEGLLFSALQDHIKSNPLEFQKVYKQWADSVKSKVNLLGFFDDKGYRLASKISFIFLLVGIAFIIIYVTTFNEANSQAWSLLIGAGLGLLFGGVLGVIISVIFKPGFNRRTETGALHYKRWNNLKKFLTDFSQIETMPPESLILWEKYLVYGTSLGVADKVISSMKILLPEVSQSSAISSYPLIRASAKGIEPLAFARMLNNFSSVAHSSAYYSASSGHGGGFSGGGGGG
ncbi:MAG: DUF2207 domain-containing protein, partial [Dictyoglomi bacterium]|nr:DUF2207 domain-containing protein [Dictyoglomota bacterium]